MFSMSEASVMSSLIICIGGGVLIKSGNISNVHYWPCLYRAYPCAIITKVCRLVFIHIFVVLTAPVE